MERVDSIPQENGDIDLDWILKELDAGTKSLPETALRAAQKHCDQVTPRLMEAIRDATNQARDGKRPEGRAQFFALFLLTEFRAKEALPLILDAVSLPGKSPFDLFRGAITSTLARVLACLPNNPVDVIDSLIADRKLNEYVRWEAVQTYRYLVRDQRLERKEAVERLRRHLREAVESEDTDIAGPLVCELTRLYPAEARDDIAEAYRKGLVDTILVGMEDVERALKEGEAGILRWLSRVPPTGIPDTVDELRTWACFQEKPARPSRSLALPSSVSLTEPQEVPASRRESSVTKSSRAGRNAPCPCGSGKKFKKCCGAPAARPDKPR